MARRSKNQDSSLPASTTGLQLPARRLEALGVGLVVLALALCFALFSFVPGDDGGANLVGPAGATLADWVLGGVGAVGYVVALLALVMAGGALLGRVRLPSPLAIVSAVALVLGATILAELIVGSEGYFGHPAGGMVGLFASQFLLSVVGPAGSALTGVAVVILGVLGITDWSLSRALSDMLRLFRFLGRVVFGRTAVWVSARRAGKLREEEIIEAARSRRAQTKIDEVERERSLQASLEEKKRIAVLKATAKAEERAAKKLAKEEAEAALLAATEAAADEVSVNELLESSEFELGLPGPGDEPELVIAPRVVGDAASVISSFDWDKNKEDPESTDEDDLFTYEDDPEYEAWVARESQVPEPVTRAERSQAPALAPENVNPSDVVIHERVRDIELLDDEDEPRQVEPVLPEKPVYELPPLSLLDYEGEGPREIDGAELKARATRLEEKLRTYGVQGKVTAIRPGPVVTTYEYQPAPGVKVAKIANLSDDIAMSMEATRVRIVAPIPGRGVVGIELPNDHRENVYLKEVIGHDTFKKSKSLLTLALGKDAEGQAQVRDFQKMPHLMVAGTTGAGKSVAINTMILSLLYKATPDQVKFIMVDPKMLELSLYNDIPHLLLPVVTDAKKASLALQWTVNEMERRYQMLSDMKVRDIAGFNRKLKKLEEQRKVDGSDIADPWKDKDLPPSLPYIVVLIDEFADLMCVAARDVEASVQRLAQKARASGIHVILATQRPSTDVITGVIKNNFPSRLSFRVASRHDSATVLNAPGAENLLGMGDSLYLGVASPTPTRIHCGFVSEDEVERVVDFWKNQAKPVYDETILQPQSEDGDLEFGEEDRDEHYDMAVRIVTETRKASISALQRKLRVGYNRAARMVEMMEFEGIVGAAMGAKGEREVLVQSMGADGPPRN